MLHLRRNRTGLRTIAAFFMQLMVVMLLPMSVLHCHDHGLSAVKAQSARSEIIQDGFVNSSFADEDYCTVCGHSWPGFIVSGEAPVVACPAFDELPGRFSSLQVSQAKIAAKEGRGPPFIS